MFSQKVTLSRYIVFLGCALLLSQTVVIVLLLKDRLPSFPDIVDSVSGPKMEAVRDEATGQVWGMRISGFNREEVSFYEEWERARSRRFGKALTIFSQTHGSNGRRGMITIYFRDPLPDDVFSEKFVRVPLRNDVFPAGSTFRLAMVKKGDSLKGYKLVPK